jgi:hypothetical protein
VCKQVVFVIHQQVCSLLFVLGHELLLAEHELVLHLCHALLPATRKLLPSLSEQSFIGSPFISLLGCKGLREADKGWWFVQVRGALAHWVLCAGMLQSSTGAPIGPPLSTS